MNDRQAHRGPDDRGAWSTVLQDGLQVSLGSRRLSILDLSKNGYMPMRTPDGRYTLVHNGEVYNFQTLRGRLAREGVRFSSTGDTEVVLQTYARYGHDAVHHLRGMFAFAVWDAEREELFLARDHFGIKPLYYVQSRGRFAFASEFKAFLELSDFERRINYPALRQYLTFLWVPDPETVLEGVRKLPAGHFAVIDRSGMRLHRYWDLHFPDAGHRFETPRAALEAEFRERFRRSVREQMISDVPMGAFLSAGLDSNTIASIMATEASEPVRTFTIAFPATKRRGEVHLDDPAVARRAAARYGCRHREIEVDPDVVSLLPKLVYHMDEPTADPAIIMAYLVCHEAAEDATVLLSGIGGDELFAGYRKHRAHLLASAYRRLPDSMRQNLVEPLVQALPSLRGTPLKGYVRLAKKMVRSGAREDRMRFVTDSVYMDSASCARLCTEDLREHFGTSDPLSTHLAHFEPVRDADFVNQMLYLDTKLFMTSLNLTYNDKMSMASSVEVRVPFLDHELAQWVADNVSPRLKLNRRRGKILLRSAFRDDLPGEVLRQRKAGFGAPIDYWLADDLREMVDDLLAPQTINRRGFFQPKAVEEILREQREGQADHSFLIWQLLTLELWQRTYLDS